MPLGLWLFVGWTILVVSTGIGFFFWAWKGDQFRNVESAKFTMLQDREPEPWTDEEKRELKSRPDGKGNRV
jgi:nitrogen fixation-related uncharacterized protein